MGAVGRARLAWHWPSGLGTDQGSNGPRARRARKWESGRRPGGKTVVFKVGCQVESPGELKKKKNPDARSPQTKVIRIPESGSRTWVVFKTPQAVPMYSGVETPRCKKLLCRAGPQTSSADDHAPGVCLNCRISSPTLVLLNQHLHF